MNRAGFRLLLLCLPVALLAGCERTKSANPLSPSLAGPIAGVGISAPKPLAPASAAQIAVEQQPMTLAVENASTNGVRPLSYIFEISTEATFASKLFSQSGVKPGPEGRTALQLPQSLTPERTYYWRVKADDGANASDYSPALNFRVYTPVIILAPVQRDPADGARAQFGDRKGRGGGVCPAIPPPAWRHLAEREPNQGRRQGRRPRPTAGIAYRCAAQPARPAARRP